MGSEIVCFSMFFFHSASSEFTSRLCVYTSNLRLIEKTPHSAEHSQSILQRVWISSDLATATKPMQKKRNYPIKRKLICATSLLTGQASAVKHIPIKKEGISLMHPLEEEYSALIMQITEPTLNTVLFKCVTPKEFVRFVYYYVRT